MTQVTSLIVLLFCALAPVDAATAHDGAVVAGSGPTPSSVSVPLDALTRAKLTREPVTAEAHGKSLRCEGISLAGLLRSTNAMPAEPLRGKQLTGYVLVTARDGYRAVFSLAELDASLGNNKVLLVDRCDGKPLEEVDGPLRLIAPDESRPARWVRQVESITVMSAP